MTAGVGSLFKARADEVLFMAATAAHEFARHGGDIERCRHHPCDLAEVKHVVRAVRTENASGQPSLATMRSRIYEPNLYPSQPNLIGDLRSDAIRLLDRLDAAYAALGAIATKTRWYAGKSIRNPQEVDHALCVEVLDLAERALEDVQTERFMEACSG